MARSPKKSDESLTQSPPENFEAAMAELDAIVARMEDGSLPLKDALTNYQRGAFLLAFCRKTLNDAQQEVRILEDGMTKPFSAASDDE